MIRSEREWCVLLHPGQDAELLMKTEINFSTLLIFQFTSFPPAPSISIGAADPPSLSFLILFLTCQQPIDSSSHLFAQFILSRVYQVTSPQEPRVYSKILLQLGQYEFQQSAECECGHVFRAIPSNGCRTRRTPAVALPTIPV